VSRPFRIRLSAAFRRLPHNRLVTCNSAGLVPDRLNQIHTEIKPTPPGMPLAYARNRFATRFASNIPRRRPQYSISLQV